VGKKFLTEFPQKPSHRSGEEKEITFGGIVMDRGGKKGKGLKISN